MKTQRTVALLIETSNTYGRGLLQGIVRYVQELETRWSIDFLDVGWVRALPQTSAKWRADGIIARIETPEIARAVKSSRLPVIDVSSARLLPEVPWIEADDVAFSSLAAEHLIERGLRHFAYCGNSRFNWSNWCRESFSRHLAARGFSAEIFETDSSSRRTGWRGTVRDKLFAWLKRLPKPIGVFTCWDVVGAEVLKASRDLGICVPEELALIGVGHDDLFCDLCRPPMTSIMPDAQRAGYQAALLLDNLMAGKPLPVESKRLGPLGIVTRQSTEGLAIDDRDVAQAVRFIREHACDGINVQDVLRHVPLSRKVLEKRFQTLLGRSPHDEILRQKLARAEELLLKTELKLPAIAERTGFGYPEYLCVAFKRATGLSPGKFRKVGGTRTRW